MKLQSLLTILFVGLKLMGYIDWSWWFVFIPMYIALLTVVFSRVCVALIKKYF